MDDSVWFSPVAFLFKKCRAGSIHPVNHAVRLVFAYRTSNSSSSTSSGMSLPGLAAENIRGKPWIGHGRGGSCWICGQG